MLTQTIPEYFDKIALCLPGGGFRAAGFSLGILSLLNDCGLLPRVNAISTVSGGTITGAKYAQMMADGKTFDEFYIQLYEWLKSDHLVADALAVLKRPETFEYDSTTNKSKTVNLINAFALQYIKFIPGTFGEVDKGLKERFDKEGRGLLNICFNATDFEHGLAFRFRNDGRFGNHENSYAKPIQNRTHIGDIVAASSCFPGGFEPIIFPQDFFPADTHKFENVGLMDGGIIDNQGSSSFTTSPYEDKETEELKYTCYLLADAGNFRIEGYKPTKESFFIKLISWLFSFWTAGLLGLIVVITSYYKEYNLLIFAVFLLVLSVLLQTLLQIGLNYAQKISGINIPIKLPRRKLGLYIIDRVKSVLLLNSSIFLKGAKAANLNSLYDLAPMRTSKLSIYSLFHDKKNNKKPYWENEPKWQDFISLVNSIPQFIQDSSERSTKFKTTLWFKEESTQMLDSLILAGRSVACFSLIGHIIKNSESFASAQDEPLLEELVKLFKRLEPVIKNDQS